MPGWRAECRGRKRAGRARSLAAPLAVLLTLAGCKPQNRYVPPPPPQVGVATPEQRAITRYVFGTGNLSAVNQVDLFARVQGILQEIDYKDGALAKKGETLFVVEPAPYQAQLQQAQADQAGKEAQVKQNDAEYNRQLQLGAKDFASRSAVDTALANRDAARAAAASAQAATAQAAITYSYTRVTAPFNGVVSAHLADVGELVTGSPPTKLATITQMDPIWVTFTLSEQDVLRVRESLRRRGVTVVDLSKVPVEIGLQDETGYPHRGALDYVSPGLDPATGTITVRGIFANADRALLPGYFVRVRVPVEAGATALLVPETAIGADQLGRTVLVVDARNEVQLRHVQVGDAEGGMREITAGLQPGEHVVVDGLQRAAPGQKVAPVQRTAAAR
ncbi:MAG TPA: efflux RND transporter periplasmic adaptor subunit [Acetobacteraceae bacterium]|nr:efflux RND transporter periplasmic adaptor subunit [Acetobacteraceae bacterium]